MRNAILEELLYHIVEILELLRLGKIVSTHQEFYLSHFHLADIQLLSMIQQVHGVQVLLLVVTRSSNIKIDQSPKLI